MRARRKALLLMAAVLLMLLAYAFAASNTVPDTHAGDGNGQVLGYTVSNVHYTLLTSDPSKIDAVTFDLDASAGTGSVYAALSADGSSWTWSSACTNSGGNTWTCDFSPDQDVYPVQYLRVVATD